MTIIYPAGGFKPMDQILDRLWVGNLYSARDLLHTNPNNIRFVLNCTSDPLILPPPFKTITMRFEDGTELDSDGVLFAIRWVHDLIELGNVLICCHAGCSRSPAIASAYLVRCGMNWDEAVEYVTRRRPQAMINPIVSLSVRKALGVAPTKESLIGGDKKDEKSKAN